MVSSSLEGSEALEAVEDLETLIRLGQGAAHRLREHVHGELHEQANDTAQHLHDLENQIRQLREEVVKYVREVQTP